MSERPPETVERSEAAQPEPSFTEARSLGDIFEQLLEMEQRGQVLKGSANVAYPPSDLIRKILAVTDRVEQILLSTEAHPSATELINRQERVKTSPIVLALINNITRTAGLREAVIGVVANAFTGYRKSRPLDAVLFQVRKGREIYQAVLDSGRRQEEDRRRNPMRVKALAAVLENLGLDPDAPEYTQNVKNEFQILTQMAIHLANPDQQ